MPAALVALFLLVPALARAQPRPKVAVLRLSANGVDGALVASLDEQLPRAVAATGCCEVVSASDLTALLGFEATRQRLGCEEDGTSCAAELAGSLGATHVLSGSLGRVGDTWALALNLVRVAKAQVVGRSVQQVKGPPEALLEALDRASREATAPLVPNAPVAGKLLAVTGAALLVGALACGLVWRSKTGADGFHQADIPTANRLAVATDVLLSVGAAAGLAGGLLLVVEHHGGDGAGGEVAVGGRF